MNRIITKVLRALAVVAVMAVASPSDVATAKQSPAKSAKAKSAKSAKKPKWTPKKKSGVKGKQSKKLSSKTKAKKPKKKAWTKKQAKLQKGKKTQLVGKTKAQKAKAALESKALPAPVASLKPETPNIEASDGSESTPKEKPGVHGKKSLRSPKTGHGKFAAKAEIEVEETPSLYESEVVDSGPWLVVFVLFVLGSVGGLIYMKRKQRSSTTRREQHFASNVDMAFESQLNSLDMAPSAQANAFSNFGTGTGMRLTGETDPAGVPGGKGWGAGRIFSFLKSKAAAKGPTLKASVPEPVEAPTAPPMPPVPQAPEPGATTVIDAPSPMALRINIDPVETEETTARRDAANAAVHEPTARNEVVPESDTIIAPPPTSVRAATTILIQTPIAPAAATKAPPTPAEDWVGWDEIVAEEYWYRVYDVEDAATRGEAALMAKLKQYGFRDRRHFDRIKDAYLGRSGGEGDLTQAMMNGRRRHASEKDKVKSTEAEATKPMPSAPDTALEIALAGVEPCSFERWVEIKVAQACWIEQSLDIETNLKIHFEISLEEWDAWSEYWSLRFAATPDLKKDHDRFEAKYKAMYGAAA